MHRPPPETSEEAADALRELGNIAFTHAATALAALLRRRVDVTIPSVRVIETERVERQVAERDESLYVVSFRLSGDHLGTVAVLLPQAGAWALVGILHGDADGRSPDAEEEATLREIGNIMAGSALVAMNRMLGTTLLHGTPSFYRRSALQGFQDAFSGPLVLVVEAEFAVEGRHARGTMIISPQDPAPILAILGIRPEASA